MIAAWAVGGIVSSIQQSLHVSHVYVLILDTFYIPHNQDFYYPENVAYPVGGPGNSQFVMLEMHYDNPQLVSGDDNVALKMIIACNSYHYYCTAAILTHHSNLHTQELLIALVWNSPIPILLHNIVLDL